MQVHSLLHKANHVWLSWILHRLPDILSCTHPHLTLDEGMCYCPDCGKGLIFKWVFIRCNGCHQRRNSVSFWEQIIPCHPFCQFCGEQSWHLQYLEQPEFFQLHTASLMLYKGDFENHREPLNSVKAWVDRTSERIRAPIAKIRA
jgi:hypothetical protein